MKAKNFPWTFAGLMALLLAAFIAELFRVSGFLILDLLTPLLVSLWILTKVLKHFRKNPHLKNLKSLAQNPPFLLPKTLWPALLFIFIGLSSLLLHSAHMSTSEFISAALYPLRWIAFFTLSILVMNESPRHKSWIFHGLIGLGLLLSLAGFIQLQIAPDFELYEELGWDPHKNRLLSTWFDPNFVGGFFAFLLALMLGHFFEAKGKEKIWLTSAGLIIVAALGLTLSRSSYLALGAGVLIIGLLRSWRMLVIMATFALLATAAVPQVQDRVLQLTGSIEAVFTESYTLPDSSSRKRFASWEAGWDFFAQHPFIGIGYNRFEDAALQSGYVTDPSVHSASGSDASLLTILATTGLLGFLPFISIYLLLAHHAWKNWRKHQHGLSLGFLGGLAGLFIHSIFVNSLLFPLFLAPFWITTGLTETKNNA